MGYLEDVRQLAVAKGVDPDEVEKSIVSAAIATNCGVEDIAYSFLCVIQWDGQNNKKGEA